MIKASVSRRDLVFKIPAGTSRGVFTKKISWFISLYHEGKFENRGIGEISPIPGLSIDNLDKIENKITETINQINKTGKVDEFKISQFPSIQFGIETALKDLKSEGIGILYPSPFTKGVQAIIINGLIWMGGQQFMVNQVKEKIKAGFRCIKLKIGAIDFETELLILKSIRDKFSPSQLELRVDANGAFSTEEAENKLEELAALEIHSIEQPIKQGQWEQMKNLCIKNILPIALDEELIGISERSKKKTLLENIKPHYIILKPSLLGGFKECEEWITLAENMGIGWWITSALESNIGLNAIAQWTTTLNNNLFQGLGTGGLYTNNVKCPLTLKGENLYYFPNKDWDLGTI